MLVSRYLGNADAKEREDILKALEGLGADFKGVKEWVAAAASYTPQQPGLHRRLVSIGERKGEYFVYVPSSYVPDKSWPAILALHGVGGSGYGQAMAWLKSSVHNDDFIFITPTYGTGLWWEQEAEKFVLSVLNQAKKDYNIDTNRIYLTGFSSGGHGAWYMALRYPALFAAINPVAGECPIPSLLANLLHVPVYIIHGARDTVILVEAARDASSRLERLNYNVVYKELPELRHKFPTAEVGEVLNWFRTNKRPLYPKRVEFSTEYTRYSMAYWIEITAFSGMVGQVYGIPGYVHGRMVRPEVFPETATIAAEIREGNEIYLTTQGIKALRIYLDDGLIDMENSVRVYINGRSVYFGKVCRSVRTLLDTVRKKNDRKASFAAHLDLRVPSE
ncbi:MAG: dienelactone hydrolase family protein [Candidatus Brocadiales bacterium]